jgi:hypothetical protein
MTFENYIVGIVGNVISVRLYFALTLYFVWKGDYDLDTIWGDDNEKR